MHTLKARILSERGISGLLVAGVVVPTVMLILFAVIDMSRVPMAHFSLRQVLMRAGLGAERQAFDDGFSSALIEPALPAAQSFTDLVLVAGNMAESAPDVQGVLSETNAAALVKGACELAIGQLKHGASSLFWRGLSSDGYSYAFQFGIYQIDPAQNDPVSIAETANDAAECSSGKEFGDFFGAYSVNTAGVMANMYKSFAQRGDGGWNGAGAFAIQDTCSDCSVSAEAEIMNSYWLIGVGYVEVNNIVGSLMGSSSKVVVDYFIRSFSAPASLQGTSQSFVSDTGPSTPPGVPDS